MGTSIDFYSYFKFTYSDDHPNWQSGLCPSRERSWSSMRGSKWTCGSFAAVLKWLWTWEGWICVCSIDVVMWSSCMRHSEEWRSSTPAEIWNRTRSCWICFQREWWFRQAYGRWSSCTTPNNSNAASISSNIWKWMVSFFWFWNYILIAFASNAASTVLSGVGRIFYRAVQMLDVRTTFAWRREAPSLREARTEARSAVFARSAHRGAKRRVRAKRGIEAQSAEWNRGRGIGEPLPKKIFEILNVQRCNLEAFGSVILLL